MSLQKKKVTALALTSTAVVQKVYTGKRQDVRTESSSALPNGTDYIKTEHGEVQAQGFIENNEDLGGEQLKEGCSSLIAINEVTDQLEVYQRQPRERDNYEETSCDQRKGQ